MRKILTPLLVVLLTIFGFGSIGEAAQKHSVRHRPKHTTHVTTGSTTFKKKATKTRRRAPRTSAASKRKGITKPK